MISETESDADPAAVFACAFSLWEECREQTVRDRSLDLSAAYSGWDQLMREVMRIGLKFEQWAIEHVCFDDLGEVWPYMLGDRFGTACLSVLTPTDLASFAEDHCLRVALRLRLPLQPADNPRIAVDVYARNPIYEAGFKIFRIQTIRSAKDGSCVLPFTRDDDPFDEEFGAPVFGVYGIDENDELEHISDRGTYFEAVDLVTKLAPGIRLPENPVSERNR